MIAVDVWLYFRTWTHEMWALSHPLPVQVEEFKYLGHIMKKIQINQEKRNLY